MKTVGHGPKAIEMQDSVTLVKHKLGNLDLVSFIATYDLSGAVICRT